MKALTKGQKWNKRFQKGTVVEGLCKGKAPELSIPVNYHVGTEIDYLCKHRKGQ